MKIRSVGAELFDSDRQMDMKKLIVTFLKFAKMTDIVYFVV